MFKGFQTPMNRLLNLVLSAVVLVITSPLLATLALCVWLTDRHSPFYVADRVGLNGQPFRMIKFRSMMVNSDKSGVDSTASDDRRLTAIGKVLRNYKLDELPQFWNVLMGEMNLVGPRPNVERETRLYSLEERRLLAVRPGITDIASIVFADESEILSGSEDPDVTYNQLIRPGKSRLALFYVAHRSLRMDLSILTATALALVNRQRAVDWIATMLQRQGAPDYLVRISMRVDQLVPSPPPGYKEAVRSREVVEG